MYSRLLTFFLIIVVTPVCLSATTCTYRLDIENYVCELINQIVESENDLNIIDGQHLGVYGNQNVTSVIAINSTIGIFPSLLIDTFENLKTFTMTNVMMTSFVSSITKCEHLESITVSRNKLSEVPARIFEKCEKLNELNLMDNDIVNVDEYAFSGLVSLRRLYLQQNRIGTLNENVLHPLRNLSAINLSDNKMNKMATLPLLFEASINLEYVWVDYNNFTNLPPSFFASCVKLNGVSVIGNQMTNINVSLFRRNGNLIEFESGYNQIEEVPAFEGIEKLVRLDLNNNRIRKIDAASFGNFPMIELLRLSNNHIETIEVESFRSMARLRVLSLDNNNLTSLERYTFVPLNRLEYLDLSNNQLIHLTADWLNGLLLLTRLNLNFNQIERVDVNFLEMVPQLEQLDMLNNVCTNDTHTIYYYDEIPTIHPSLNRCNNAIINGPSLVVTFIALWVSSLKW